MSETFFSRCFLPVVVSVLLTLMPGLGLASNDQSSHAPDSQGAAPATDDNCNGDGGGLFDAGQTLIWGSFILTSPGGDLYGDMGTSVECEFSWADFFKPRAAWGALVSINASSYEDNESVMVGVGPQLIGIAPIGASPSAGSGAAFLFGRVAALGKVFGANWDDKDDDNIHFGGGLVFGVGFGITFTKSLALTADFRTSVDIFRESGVVRKSEIGLMVML